MRSINLVFFFLFSFIILISCDNNSHDSSCKGICQKLDSGYNKYLQKIDSIGKLRGHDPNDSLKAHLPISEQIGKHYVSMFQGEYLQRALPQTHYLKISRDNIEFLYNHMLNEKLDTLAFAFAKYDTTGFASSGIAGDSIYNSRAYKMKDRYTIVIGEWRVAEREKFHPFSLKGMRFRFFDDWHNEDP